MSKNRNDGGEAFPSGKPASSNGMSLRDYFAGQALAGLLANPGGPVQANGMSGWAYTNCTIEQVSAETYRVADAMLAQREKGQQ